MEVSMAAESEEVDDDHETGDDDENSEDQWSDDGENLR
jgi:hypothetical protein